MKSISFKNFRRFADFPEFKFGDITILVGGNNAGKSTLLKALILIVDNLRELKNRNEGIFNSFWPTFSFDMDHIHQLNLGTYYRAHKNGAEDGITFDVSFSHFNIIFKVNAGNDTEKFSPSATIVSISIFDKKRNVGFWFNLNEMILEFKDFAKNTTLQDESSVDYYNDLLNKLEVAKELEDIALIASLNEEMEKAARVRQQMSISNRLSLGRSDNGTVVAPVGNYVSLIKEYDLTVPSNPVARLLYNWIGYQSLNLPTEETVDLDGIVETAKENPDLIEGRIPYEDYVHAFQEGLYTIEDHKANKLFLEDKVSVIREIAQELDNALYRINEIDEIFYIQAHAITQRVLYSIDNRNDYMAQVLHKFARENIQKGTEPDRFLKKWLALFGIGLDYDVSDIAGEGYTIKIKNEEGGWHHLADLGMGSNQLVTLLMELATLLKVKGNRQYPLIIIEEPEQNLHPKVQSLLVQLFSELNKERGFKFLIETHSEYLIRHTQVLVSEMNLNEEELESQNPFKVYYFPEEGVPYDMKYQPDGHFEEAFGEGFFDEAGKWTRELIRSKRR